jgi:uncharacterized protein (TIGR02246 family)
MMKPTSKVASMIMVSTIATIILSQMTDVSGSGADKQEVTAITSLRNEYAAAWKSGDAEHVARLYTNDGIVLYPNKPAVVGANILAYFKDFFDQFVQKKFELTSEEVTIAGHWAFDRGTYVVSVTPRKGGKAIEDNGKYLVILQRQGDGSWKVVRDLDNSNNPLPL